MAKPKQIAICALGAGASALKSVRFPGIYSGGLVRDLARDLATVYALLADRLAR